MDPTLSTKLYNKLVKADPCWYKVDDLYFSSCPLELYFCKNKTWAKDPQYDSLWKWFNQLQVIIIELDEIGHKLIAKEQRVLKDTCKCLKNVDFSKPATRVPEICKALLELNITVP